MALISRIKDEAIRKEWDPKTGQFYFSVVDVIGIAAQTRDSRNYWKVFKNRLKQADNQLVTACNQLKMMANDGKFYMTDVADEETLLKMITLISEENVPIFRAYFEELNLKQNNITISKDTPENSTNSIHKNLIHSYPQSLASEPLHNGHEINDDEFSLMVDAYKKNDTFIIQAFVAGIDIENLLISTTCKNLNIKGERELIKKNIEKFNNKNYLREELYWGKFSRTIELPEEVEINKVEAIESHGLLTITLPIINKNRSRIIKTKLI
jgi:HSP20 family molecular chaperone IbpA